jgi:peroxiredoxin
MRSFLLALGCALLAACGTPDTGPKMGSAAPRFEATDLDGKLHRFPEDFAGKPVILDFWADWCRYCANSMTQIDRLQREHAASGLVVLAVNVAQDRATAAAFIERLGVGYSAVLDPESRITRQYGVKGLPMTIFVDRNGLISGKVIGELDEKLLAIQLERILPKAR